MNVPVDVTDLFFLDVCLVPDPGFGVEGHEGETRGRHENGWGGFFFARGRELRQGLRGPGAQRFGRLCRGPRGDGDRGRL